MVSCLREGVTKVCLPRDGQHKLEAGALNKLLDTADIVRDAFATIIVASTFRVMHEKNRPDIGGRDVLGLRQSTLKVLQD